MGLGASNKKKKLYEDSSDYTSDEDFDFLDKAMKEDGKLDPMTAKLLRGVIQRPEDEKKRE